MSNILQAVASGSNINVDSFKKYCLETADMYCKEYSWYHMPTAVHKILVHGASIINSCDLPIGQLSEEALEANHKFCKKFRRDFTRKHSRLATNEDLMHRLILRSDPLTSLAKTSLREKKQDLSFEVQSLLNLSLEDDG